MSSQAKDHLRVRAAWQARDMQKPGRLIESECTHLFQIMLPVTGAIAGARWQDGARVQHMAHALEMGSIGVHFKRGSKARRKGVRMGIP